MTAAKVLPVELINSLLSGYKKPEDLIGENSLLKQLTKALVERALDAEMEAHLGHAKVRAKAVYLALGIWIAQTEGAKF